MASHHQPEPAPRPPLPGDIVQVTDRQDRWFMALLVVEEFRRWGLKAHALVPTEDGVAQAYYRIAHGKYELVGTSRLIDADTARARKDAEQTARLLQKEKGDGE